MKTRILLILAILSFFTISLYSQNKYDIQLKHDEKKAIKEYTAFDPKTSEKQFKVLIKYDKEGHRTARTLYMWNKNHGWIGGQKHEYSYNTRGKISKIIHTKWDKNKDDWSSKSEIYFHYYDVNDQLLAVKTENK